MLEDEAPLSLEDRLIVFGALAFLVGTAAAAYLYALDPYALTFELFVVSPSASWPFYVGSGGLASLAAGGLLVRFRG